jgi:hypothetical protein
MVHVALAILGICTALSQSAVAQTRLGLHVTQEELTIWRQRMVSGPYRIAGDASTNSPGDWAQILSWAATFAGNTNISFWQGNTTGKPWAPTGSMNCSYSQGGGMGPECTPTSGQGKHIAAAGFATLVDPSGHNYAAQVRTMLLSQISQTGTDFTNNAKWPNTQLGDAYSGNITHWLTRLAYAYDYVRIASPSTFSAGEKASIETWFSNAAFYWGRNVDYLVRNAFPNRNTEFDTSVAIGSTYPTDATTNWSLTTQANILYYDCTNNLRGPYTSSIHDILNNRSGAQIRFVAVGSLLNGTLPHDAQSKRWAKMWFKEWLTYAVFPNNMVQDYKRWCCSTTTPTNGWQYASQVTASMVTIADVFARTGDTSLYDFSTSGGWTFGIRNPAGYNANTAGGPKSLLKVIQRHYSFVNQRATGIPGWVGSDDVMMAGSGGPHCANRTDYLIQPHDTLNGVDRIEDTRAVPANLYYRDAAYTRAYTRQVTGAPTYPANPVTNNDAYAWGGDWWTYPGVLFMFGQMEGKVSPYPGGPAVSLSAPSNLRIMSIE